MTEYFIPQTKAIKLSNGTTEIVVKGIREVSDALANDPIANKYLKPVHEMTAAERADMKLPPAPPDVDESLKVEPEDEPKAEVKAEAKTPLLDVKPALTKA